MSFIITFSGEAIGRALPGRNGDSSMSWTVGESVVRPPSSSPVRAFSAWRRALSTKDLPRDFRARFRKYSRKICNQRRTLDISQGNKLQSSWAHCITYRARVPQIDSRKRAINFSMARSALTRACRGSRDVQGRSASSCSVRRIITAEVRSNPCRTGGRQVGVNIQKLFCARVPHVHGAS